jgi:DNA-binding IclR family transcriptional regulator
MENNTENSWRTLKTVEGATAVIETLAELDGAGVTELASNLDMSKSTVHSHLATLEATGYLVNDGGTYRLSYQFLLLGEYVRNRSALFQFGRAKANTLAAETGHYAHLYIEERGLGVNIYEARGDEAGNYEYQSLKLQRREPLHITASGKAVLAHLPDERVDEIISEHGLERYTENTITDESELYDELETIRQQGYAVNDMEEVEGFRAVAAPVQTGGSEVLGSLSVSGPTSYLSGDTFRETIPQRVVNATNLIEVNVNMSNLHH